MTRKQIEDRILNPKQTNLGNVGLLLLDMVRTPKPPRVR